MNPQEFVSQRNDKGIPTTAATFIPLTRFDGLTGQSSSPLGAQTSPTGGAIPNDPQYTVKRRVSHNEGIFCSRILFSTVNTSSIIVWASKIH